MKAAVNPELPVVVSASTDIGYVTYLMAKTERYRDWSLSRASAMILPALTRRQLRVYIDDSGNPMGFIAWAFVGDSELQRFEAGDTTLEQEEWSSGARLLLLHIVAPFGGARAIVRDFMQSIAKGPQGALRLKYGESNGTAKVVPLRSVGQSTPKFEENLVFDQLVERTSGSSLSFGFFSPSQSNGWNAFAEASRRICQVLDPKAGDRVLDTRCRTGDLALAISTLPDVSVDGVDWSAYRVLAAWEKNKEDARSRFMFRRHEENLPDEVPYDGVVRCDGLTEVVNYERILAELARATKPGGRLVLTDLVIGDGMADTEADPSAWHEPIISERTLSADLTDAGFDIETIEDWTSHQIRSDRWLIERLPIDQPRARRTPALIDALSKRTQQAEQGNLKRIVVIAKRRDATPLSQVRTVPATDTKKVTLVMLSGGLDSVYTLWKLLTETDDTVLVHHINFVNFERRYVIEAERCRKIVEYLQKQVREFQYSETTLDRRSQLFAGYDTMACGYEVGIVASSFLLKHNRAVDRWTVGSCLEEGGWSARWRYVEDSVKSSAYPLQAPEFFTLPIVSKQEEIDAVPSELLRLTWACRRPILTEAGYEPCGVCQTCKLFAQTSHGIG